MPDASSSISSSSRVYAWEELTRQDIKELAPSATVLVPLGAIEQHGPFLPTGTDIILCTEAVRRAALKASRQVDTPYLVASFLRIGSSDHHLPFGGTISLPPSTMLQVLTDAIRSMVHSGVKRVVLVNGHGGNTGVCHAAAAAITTTTSLSVAVVDYFDYGALKDTGAPVPGHAGRWETSLILGCRPELVKALNPIEKSADAKDPGRGIYSSSIWESIDGYTDRPHLANPEEGSSELDAIERQLAARLVEIAEVTA